MRVIHQLIEHLSRQGFLGPSERMWLTDRGFFGPIEDESPDDSVTVSMPGAESPLDDEEAWDLKTTPRPQRKRGAGKTSSASPTGLKAKELSKELGNHCDEWSGVCQPRYLLPNNSRHVTAGWTPSASSIPLHRKVRASQIHQEVLVPCPPSQLLNGRV